MPGDDSDHDISSQFEEENTQDITETPLQQRVSNLRYSFEEVRARLEVDVLEANPTRQLAFGDRQ